MLAESFPLPEYGVIKHVSFIRKAVIMPAFFSCLYLRSMGKGSFAHYLNLPEYLRFNPMRRVLKSFTVMRGLFLLSK